MNWLFKRPWVFPVLVFACVIAVWVVFFALARKQPMVPVPEEQRESR